MNRAFAIFTAFLLLAGGSAAIGLAVRLQRAAEDKNHPRGQVERRVPKISSAENLTSYELTERSGGKFDSKTLAGKVHVVNFFYATCPARCPMQTQHMAQLQALLNQKGIDASKAMLVSITVDPANDTAAVLREYADRYKADSKQWVFLTGDLDYMSRVAVEIYQTAYKAQVHSEKVLLVDKWGRIRGDYRWYDPTDFAVLKREMLKLVEETEPPPLEPEPVEEVAGAKEAREEEAEERALYEKQKAEETAKSAAPK
jgi:cytochrome oxidase Cu insertion factor (SCO1/SenC/PrrC family)